LTRNSRPRTIGGRFHDQARAILRARRDVDITVGQVQVRVASLPLLKRAADGLQQAVRVELDTPSPAAVRLRLEAGGQVQDERTVDARAGRTVEYLLLNAVDRPSPCSLDVAVGEARGRAQFDVRPHRRWRVFLIHQSHLDIGYTDPQDLILRHHAGFLDAVLDLAECSDGLPEDARFRWNVEATWPLDHWLRTRPEAARRRFFDLAHAGRIEVTALPFNMHTEVYSIDELARQVAIAERLRDEHTLPIVTAMQTDVPGATLGLLNLLTEAEVRYLSVAHNYAGRSVPHLLDGQQLTRPFWWRAATGKRLLTWYTDTPHGSAYMEGNLAGLAEGYEAALDLFPAYLAALAEQPYPYLGAEAFGWFGALPGTSLSRQPYPHDILHLRVNGEIADNAPPSQVLSGIVQRWNQEWAYPRLRLATNREFFEAAEQELGDHLDTFEGDWTDWWADGVGSAARELGFGRSAQVLAPVAQAMHTLSDALGAEGSAGWQSEVNEAYEAMALFDEHTWGAANPWRDSLEQIDSGGLQWQRKADFARRGRDQAELAHEHAAIRLAGLVAGGGGAADSHAQVAVFNPSGNTRTDVADVFLPATRVEKDRRFELVDELTGRALPYELAAQAHAAFRPRGRWLRFVAHDVPGLGYRRYVLRARPPSAAEDLKGALDATLESDRYRAEVDVERGVLVSLVDLATGRELLQADSPFGFNQYIYDRYASAAHFNHLSGRIPRGDLWLLGGRSVAEQGVTVKRSRTPLADRLKVRLSGEGSAWIETTYELLREVPRLDVRNRVYKLAVPEKESVYFAFPFRVTEPRVSCEITGGVDTGDAARVPGSARHMRAIRNWVSFEDAGGAVAWATGEAPLVQVGDLHLPYAPFPITFESGAPDRATVFSWAMNNIWDTNFPDHQGGETVFRYAAGSAAAGADPRRLGMDVAAGFSRPLVAMLCPASTESPEPVQPSGSFCQLNGAAAELVTIAPSRGGGLALFIASQAAEPAEVELRFPDLRVRRVRTGPFTERDLVPLPLRDGAARLRLAPGEYRAVVLDLEGSVTA
jgi:hypothetical protein